MAMGSERSKPLHNFTMPCLKWGNQRFLRCMKVNPNGGGGGGDDRRSSATELEKGLIRRRRELDPERRGSVDRIERSESFAKSPSPSPSPGVGGSGRKSKVESDGDDGIEAVRAKLMFDLQTAADKMKFAILREGLDKEPLPATATTTTTMTTLAAQAEADAARPWNLRTRRAACKAPNNGTTGGAIGGGGSVNGGGAKNLRIDERKPNFSPLRADSKSPRLRGDLTATATANVGEKRERAKFSVSLSRREIEEDFTAVTGHRPPRRPKKRPKIVQKQLDNLFPGFWLMEVSADFYKVPDVPETGKP